MESVMNRIDARHLSARGSKTLPSRDDWLVNRLAM